MPGPILTKRMRTSPLRQLQWLLLFVAFFVAIWAATQSRQAPQIVLIAALYLVTLNFALPSEHGSASLVTVVAVTSFFMLGLQSALLLLSASILLAEFLRPLWDPLWHGLEESVIPRKQHLVRRWGLALIHFVALYVGGIAYLSGADQPPLGNPGFDVSTGFFKLSLLYGLIHSLGKALLWKWEKRRLAEFPLVPVVVEAFLSHPFALLGAMVYAGGGLRAFVVFCLGIVASSIVVWQSWQRRYSLGQRLREMFVLNEMSLSLRETLDLRTILSELGRHIEELLAVDNCYVALELADGRWERAEARSTDLADSPLFAEWDPDDLSLWVHRRGKILQLDDSNLHFAHQHNFTLPDRMQAEWLGIPLEVAGDKIGVIVFQSTRPNSGLGVWSRQLLVAIAGMASSAIQNARLHEETVRLFHLSDAQLAQRVEQLQALLDAMQEGVLMIDASGRIVLRNATLSALLGVSDSYRLGARLDSRTPAASLGYPPGQLAALIAGLGDSQIPEVESSVIQVTPAESGEGTGRRIMLRTGTPVVSVEGAIIGWLMLFRDITEEQELESMRVDLTRMIVHDLRNPLTTLSSTIDHLSNKLDAETGSSSGESGELVELARRGTVDMLDMVDSLMDVSRLESGQAVLEAEAMRFPALVDELLTRLRPVSVQRNIQLTFHCSDRLPAVWADEEMIRRVLLNLLDNALKFTPSGGRISGFAEPEISKSRGRHNGIRCTIVDTGPGIPEAAQGKIFDRFMRTNPGGAQIRGTGLGLAFCKLAIDAHGGSIWVEAPPHIGSSFIFTLPGLPK